MSETPRRLAFSIHFSSILETASIPHDDRRQTLAFPIPWATGTPKFSGGTFSKGKVQAPGSPIGDHPFQELEVPFFQQMAPTM